MDPKYEPIEMALGIVSVGNRIVMRWLTLFTLPPTVFQGKGEQYSSKYKCNRSHHAHDKSSFYLLCISHPRLSTQRNYFPPPLCSFSPTNICRDLPKKFASEAENHGHKFGSGDNLGTVLNPCKAIEVVIPIKVAPGPPSTSPSPSEQA